MILRKFILVSIFLFTVQPVLADTGYSDNLINNLIYCKPYKEISSVFGSDIVEEIKGWNNNKCVYKSYPKSNPEYVTTCKFNTEHLNEFKKAYQLKKNNLSMKKDFSVEGVNATITTDPYSALFTVYSNEGTCQMPDFGF